MIWLRNTYITPKYFERNYFFMEPGYARWAKKAIVPPFRL